MRILSNRLSDILKFYKSELVSVYSCIEIESLFYWTCEELLGQSRSQYRYNLLQTVSESMLLKFNFTVKALKNHTPIQYVFNKAYFYDLSLYVNEAVLIPRPETEELVHWIIQDYKKQKPHTIIDLCTGSGCIALALQNQFPSTQMQGLDISSEALTIAKQNGKNLNMNILWSEANILDVNLNLKQSFDIIVSNPPYVRLSEQKQMQANVLDNEPHLALFVSDKTPLLFYEAIARFSKIHLQAKGSVYLEINEALGKETSQLFRDYGFSAIELRKDMQNKDRMLKIGF